LLHLFGLSLGWTVIAVPEHPNAGFKNVAVSNEVVSEAGPPSGRTHAAMGSMSPTTVRSRLEWIASQAQKYPHTAFTTLAHHLDVALLERAFRRLNPRSSPGIDRVTWQAYKRNLDTNLEKLHERLVLGTYRPQVVVRRWISKSGGKYRPLGIPALDDKVVQRAVAMLLEQIYEQDFYGFSYGFRPGRSCHQALRALRQGMLHGVRHVIDCDISSFFDNLQHDQLLAILRKRVNDGRLLQLIEMWLKAGRVVDGQHLGARACVKGLPGKESVLGESAVDVIQCQHDAATS
jgi:RNA-directed DNA polymerase